MCGCLSCTLLGTWPTTQACALTGNRTGDPLGYRPDTQSTEPHQPGQNYFLRTFHNMKKVQSIVSDTRLIFGEIT